MSVLVNLLETSQSTTNSREIQSQTIQALEKMLAVSKSRQEKAAICGLVPHLIAIIQHNDPLKDFAIPMFCGLANTSHGTRKILWNYEGIDVFLSILKQVRANSIRRFRLRGAKVFLFHSFIHSIFSHSRIGNHLLWKH